MCLTINGLRTRTVTSVRNSCTISLFNPTTYFKRQHFQAILSSRSSNASPSTGFLKKPNAPLCR
jgi:hypothetical protein